MPESHIHILDIFHKACDEFGILASTQNQGNYKRIWTRDMVVSSMASFLLEDQKSLNSLKNGLEYIASFQHPQGFIPSNVDLDGKVSYGGLVGRTDVLSWFIIGVCKYAQQTQQMDFYTRMKPFIEKALNVMNTYEFNGKGLMYLPLASNWADEYIFSGYVLFDNVLRLWAYKLLNGLENQIYAEKQAQIEQLILSNFQLSKEDNPLLYHKRLNQQLKNTPYWMASFTPSRYYDYFDSISNSLLVCLLNVEEKNKAILNYAEKICSENDFGLLPAHHPTIEKNQEDWNLLENNYLYHFSNYPNEYHNGGIWPMVQMWYGFALKKYDKMESLQNLYEQTHKMNIKDQSSFYENYHAETGKSLGIPFCTWSVAADLALSTLKDKNLQNFFPEFYL